jgi:hypothetical protein
MKALEILEESKKISEAPPSALGQVGRRLGAAALGAVGMKHTAAGISGKADLVAKSREYYAAYKKFLSRIGKTEADADLTDLRDFYIKNGLPANDVPTSGPADQDTVFDILKKTAAGDYRGRSTSSSDTAASNSVATGNAASGSEKMSLQQIQTVVDNLPAAEKTKLLGYLQNQLASNPGQVRQAKQAKAAQVAQAQMANTPAAGTAKPRSRRRGRRRGANVAV